MFVPLGTSRISKGYSSRGYISINIQVIYPLCLQHSYIYPHKVFYEFSRLCILCIPNMVLFLLIIYMYRFSYYATDVLPKYSNLPSIYVILIGIFIFMDIMNVFFGCVFICLIDPVLKAQNMNL